MPTHPQILLITLLTLTPLLSACDGAVQNFVKTTNPPSTGREPQAAPEGPQQLTISGGSVDSGTTGVRMKAKLGPNEQTFNMGGDRKASLSIGRTRVN